MAHATDRVDTDKLVEPDEKLTPVTVAIKSEDLYVGVSVGSTVGGAAAVSLGWGVGAKSM